MREYQDYQQKIKEVEAEEKNGGLVEEHVPALFLLIGALISAAATFYLNEAGMRNSPLYRKTIGAENAAWLVTAILEGSFLALTLLGHQLLKSEPQRRLGKTAILALKVVLSLNVIVAFVMLAGFRTTIMPMVETYAQWGVPVSVVGAIWLWAAIVSNRRKTIMRNEMLDRSAQVERVWAEQFQKDQLSYREAYRQIVGSPDMELLRQEVARKQAIAEIARVAGLTYDEAAVLADRSQAQRAFPANQDFHGTYPGKM